MLFIAYLMPSRWLTMKSLTIKILKIILMVFFLLDLFSEYFFSIIGLNNLTLISLLDDGFSIIIFLSVILIISIQYKLIKITEENERKFRRLFESANDAIYLFELTAEGMPGKFVEVNKIACERFGYSRDELLIMSPVDITSDKRKEKIYETQRNLLEFGKITFEGEYVCKNGSKIPSEIHVSIFKYNNRNHALAISRDISERKKSEELVYKMAYYDLLTGLPNRRLFEEQLFLTLQKIPIEPKIHAFMFIDLDGFKQINDTFGHDVGDFLLQAVSLRLKDTVRDNDIVSRCAGDEFTILLPNITEEDTLKVAERILESFQTPIIIGKHIIHVSCSVGISFSSSNQNNIETLMRHADLAMYDAKHKGKNTYQIYDDSRTK